MAKQRTGKLAISAVVAAGIGYAAGVLTAPKSGKQTRRDIQKATVKAKKEAEAKLKSLHSDLSNLISEGKRQAKATSSKAKSGFDEAINRAQTAKDKARQLLSAVHEGEADDKDLQKAIDDVKKATQHLKSFVIKDTKDKDAKPKPKTKK